METIWEIQEYTTERESRRRLGAVIPDSITIMLITRNSMSIAFISFSSPSTRTRWMMIIRSKFQWTLLLASHSDAARVPSIRRFVDSSSPRLLQLCCKVYFTCGRMKQQKWGPAAWITCFDPVGWSPISNRNTTKHYPSWLLSPH